MCAILTLSSIAMLWRIANSCVLMNVAHSASEGGPNAYCSAFVGQTFPNLRALPNRNMNQPETHSVSQDHSSRASGRSAAHVPPSQRAEQGRSTRPRHLVFELPDCRKAAIAVVLPTYNEASNLEELVDSLFSLPLPNLRLVVVDDNSPDGTGELAEKLARRHNQARSKISVIHRPRKSGLGTAYVTGFQHALADGADFIVQMDADFSHSPSYIMQMLGVICATGMDVVIGSRYVPGGSLDENWNWWRSLLSKWANIYCRSVLKIRVRDMTAGFKLWQRDALREIQMESIRSNGYIFQVEMAYLSEKLGFHIIELPIHFEDRRVGQSKMDVAVKLESVWRVWELLWRHRKRVAGSLETPGRPQPTVGSERHAAHR